MSRPALLICVALIAVAACGRLGAPTAPSDLAASGTWSGNVSVASEIGQMTWVAVQSGTTLTGPARIVHPGGAVLLSGTLSGVLSGSKLTYAFEVPAGGFTDDPGCSARLEGTATIARGTPSTMTGSYAVTSGACATFASRGSFILTSGPAAMPVGPVAPSG